MFDADLPPPGIGGVRSGVLDGDESRYGDPPEEVVPRGSDVPVK